MPSGSYFFSYMNRIGSVVELKIYIRVHEEFVPTLSCNLYFIMNFSGGRRLNFVSTEPRYH